MDSHIDYYYRLIMKEKPTFLETKNSYKRKCIYTAIERINKNLENNNDLEIKKIFFKICSAIQWCPHIWNKIWIEFGGCKRWNINCNRKKEWVLLIAPYDICKKHYKPLTGGCDVCDDPWCLNRPEYEDCYDSDDAHENGVGKRAELYKSKITTGLNIYYSIKFKN